MVMADMVAQENNMAKKKVKQEETEVVDTKTIKQRRPRVQKTNAVEETITEHVVDPIIEQLEGILNLPIEEPVEQIIIEENTWISIVSVAESLYITLQDEYKKRASNDISSMLILMSSVIKSAKKRI